MNEAAPDNTPSARLHEQARQAMEKRQYGEAQRLLEKLLAAGKTAPAAHDLGMACHLQGNDDDAIEYFQMAVDIDPAYTPSYVKAAEILLENGYALHALGCYAAALQVCPNDIALKESFVGVAYNTEFTEFNPAMKALYVQCLETPALDFSSMGKSWFSLFRQDPAFKTPYKLLSHEDYTRFTKSFAAMDSYDFLRDPYFVLALKKQVRVCDVGYERFICHLRHAMLDQLEKEDRILDSAAFTALAEALAHYCFHTEYIFDTGEDEWKKTDTLRSAQPTEDAVAILACYVPLHTLENAQKLEQQFSSTAIADLIEIQITAPRRQQEIKKTIESLTETTDAVSVKVQEQYEEFPYPRWTGYHKIMHDADIEKRIQGRAADILVAGCGTGREAIELAHVFPDAQVLAVDLSFTSLAYGISKAQEFGIENVTFRQADIMKLGQLGRQFDYIASSGVLHHMEHPEVGWKIVSGLLKPGGLMRLCLYSRLARQPIIRAREIIEQNGFSSCADDIRRFRKEAANLLKSGDYKNITGYADYYSLSECRDLLFHVQEHQYTLPEIKQWLDQAGMDCLGFYVGGDTLAKYQAQHPQDPDATNLDLWAVFEEQNPDSFINMYRLWLNKR